MKKVWDEDAIRKELARLDGITGLNGAELPIRFTDAQCVIGCYHLNNGERFSFSRIYFMDPEWAEESALDTIRHEYAHYMDYAIYGNVGHGWTWKKCCSVVAACPVRLYNSWKNDYYNKKQTEKEQKLLGMHDYKAGDYIIHPKYGKGMITTIAGVEIMKTIQVEFETAGVRKLSLAWVSDNCIKL
ncbi:MAG: hypothetical protein IKW90_12145 [Lachnospiraceae bacterium]|nr:hypothetical protein [Lachnospiraceae bacterium]